MATSYFIHRMSCSSFSRALDEQMEKHKLTSKGLVINKRDETQHSFAGDRSRVSRSKQMSLGELRKCRIH